MSLRVIVFVLFALLSGFTAAKEAVPTAEDPVLEQRVRVLAEELRCLVCQNQTIADSNADLAVDLRNQIREKLKAGMSDAAIKQFMVERYGDFVLYRPPVKSSTAFLWFGPFLLLLLGCVTLFIVLKRRKMQPANEPLSPEQEHKALELLNSAPSPDKP